MDTDLLLFLGLDGQKRTFKLSAVGRGGQDVAIIGHLRVCK